MTLIYILAALYGLGIAAVRLLRRYAEYRIEVLSQRRLYPDLPDRRELPL